MKNINNKVYFIHKESKHVVSREELIGYSRQMGEMRFSFYTLNGNEPYTPFSPNLGRLNTKHWTYDIMEIPFHDDWETVVINDLTLNTMDLINILHKRLDTSTEEKILNTLKALDRMKYHNVRIPIK